MASKSVFAIGDKVEYSRNFLKSTAWYTNVPSHGEVIEAEKPVHGLQVVTVKFEKDYQDEPRRINSANLIFRSKMHQENN